MVILLAQINENNCVHRQVDKHWVNWMHHVKSVCYHFPQAYVMMLIFFYASFI